MEPERDVAIDAIRPNPRQPRREFTAQALAELRDSIKLHGVIQPVVVRPRGAGYELVAGERRWRAARQAGLKRIPAVIREASDEEMLALALVENLQRVDLDPIERALGYRQLQESCKITQEEVARQVGLKRSTVTNHLRLLDLPGEIQEALSKGLISMGHARAILGLPGNRRRIELCAEVVRKGLSVRDLESRVQKELGGSSRGAKPGATGSGESGAPIPPWAVELEGRMKRALGTRVRIQPQGDDRGQVLIDYYDRATLERVVEALAPRVELA